MSVEQIVRELDAEITKLTRARTALIGLVTGSKGSGADGVERKKRHVSAASRRKMALAQKARWAKVKTRGRAA
jgi:hypothetical protein